MTIRRFFAFAGLLALGAWTAPAGPLQDYVNAPDPHFTYAPVTASARPGYRLFVLDMTSQSWKDGLISHPLWKHWLTIVVPDTLSTDVGMLVVSGGNNAHDRPPSGAPQEVIVVALATGSAIAVLQGVPNEPVVFADENRSRTEDEIIAYSFDKFLTTSDPTWPLLLPMVKSAVRAMDVVQDFGPRADPPFAVNRFVLTGASKRGWTTWLTPAADRRVVGIAPMVIDMLNLRAQMEQQRAYYGGYSRSIQDYTAFNLQERFNEPNGGQLLSIVDPFEYRSRLTLPKLVLLGSGDQYWTIDAARLYFGELKGPKFLRYEPNADHGLENAQGTIQALTAFYHNLIAGRPMPRFSWQIGDDGSFLVTPRDAPVEARLWAAQAPTRDFRLMTIGPAWSPTPLTPAAGGRFEGRVAAPDQGYAAFYIELVYPSALGFNYSLTTEIGLVSAG